MSLCGVCQKRLGLRPEPPRKDPRVAVIGGGIAGLTAAHELCERGFFVDVFEGSDVLGGQAATQKVCSRRIFGKDAEANPLPGEHGFRAFYSFYRHLTDTMERIPLWDRLANDKREFEDRRRPPGPPHSVASNLIPTYKVAVALEDNIFREIQYDRRQPRSMAAASYALGVWMVAMGFSSSDIVRLLVRLLQFMTSCRERRYKELTKRSLMDYLGKDLSPRFKSRFKNISRFLVAIDPAEGDALTQAMIMCRLLMDPVVAGETQKNVDRVLNGPTSERWLDPWVYFLDQQNVRFFLHQRLVKFQVRGEKVVDVRLTCLSAGCDFFDKGGDGKKGYWLNGGKGPEDGYRYFVSAVPGDALATALSASPGLLRADHRETEKVALENERALNQATAEKDTAHDEFKKKPDQQTRRDYAEKRRDAWLTAARAGSVHVTGDPDLQSWVNLVRPPTSQKQKEQAKKGKANYRPWMSGIQFYLSDNLSVLPGHIHFPDSKWALTAVCQSQFWGGDFFWRYGKGKVRSILSVDICDFEKPGEIVTFPSGRGKTALQCTRREIVREVWHQMKEGLRAWDMVLPEIFGSSRQATRPLQKEVASLSRAMNEPPAPVPLPYLDHHLDNRIVFKPDGPEGRIDQKATSIQYFVPGVDSWSARPGPLPPLESWDRGYRVRLGSLVIVGHFAQTFTSINTMEAANESARHGVNALLDHYERNPFAESQYVRFERCTIWPLEADEPANLDFWKQVDRNLYWDDKNNKPILEDGKPREHIFEILHFDRKLAALLPNPTDIDNTSFTGDKLWDSDGWKRFEKGFGGVWDKLLTLGRFSTPY